MTPAPPLAMLAELTHRCPLACGYCSNPLELDRRSDEIGTELWVRAFREAAEMGVLQLHLSGGEPAARRDLEELVAAASAAGLYVNLITSAIGIDRARLERLADAGVDHVQLSVQHVEPDAADAISGYRGSHARKREFARFVGEIGLPLTVNAVLHRGNIHAVEALAEEAVAMGARRIELAHAQYYGWALRNRAALMPTRADILAVRGTVAELGERLAGALVVDYVPPDYYARYPKPCVNGWGRQSLNVTPRGRVLPCHAAETIPSLEFWNVGDRPLAEIWARSPAFNAFRGDDWMQEPCRSCTRKNVDFGGCRCQAMAIAGDAAATDPVCSLSPMRHLVDEALEAQADEAAPMIMRGRSPAAA